MFGLFGKRDNTVAPDGGESSSRSAKSDSALDFALFSGICPADCAAVISAGREKRLARHQVLFSVGDPIEQVFLLLSGSAKITQVDLRGTEVILRVIGAGDLVGIFSLWPDGKHTSSALAVQAGTALVWDSTTFTRLLDHFAGIRHNTFRILGEHLQEMEQRFRELSTEDVPSRLSSELIRLSKRFGQGVKGKGEIRLSQTDLAQLTGTTVSTVSRLLSRWERLGIVSVRREKVQVRNPSALTQFAQNE